MKTAELIGEPLNFAVARALGKRPHIFVHPIMKIAYLTEEHQYSEEWSQGGPIIEREEISVGPIYCNGELDSWEAFKHDLEYDEVGEYIEGSDSRSYGPTPLIAAMRCYVTSELGDEVEIPEELL